MKPYDDDIGATNFNVISIKYNCFGVFSLCEELLLSVFLCDEWDDLKFKLWENLWNKRNFLNFSGELLFCGLQLDENYINLLLWALKIHKIVCFKLKNNINTRDWRY